MESQPKLCRVSSHGRGLPGGRARIQNYSDSNISQPSIAEQQRIALDLINTNIIQYFDRLSIDASNGSHMRSEEMEVDDDSDSIMRRDKPIEQHHQPLKRARSNLQKDSPLSITDQKLAALRHWIKLTGFDNVYHLATAEAQSSPNLTSEWINSSGFSQFWDAIAKLLPLRRCPNPESQAKRNEALKSICEVASRIYCKEWRSVVEDSWFKVSLKDLKTTTILSFSFSDIYARIQSIAPNVINLAESLCSVKPRRGTQHTASAEDASSDTSDSAALIGDEYPGSQIPWPNSMSKETLYRRKIMRHIVIALCVLGNACSADFNRFQVMMGYTLYAYKASRRLIGNLSHCGISSGYKGICSALRGTAKMMRAITAKAMDKGRAILACCDNCTTTAHVKNLRFHNVKAFNIDTAGYWARPPKQEPAFTPDDADYNKVHQLSLAHFIPAREDITNLRDAMRCMITDILHRFFQDSGIKPPANVQYDMPKIYQLDHTQKHTVTTLPTFALDEGQISEMIKVLHRTADAVGITNEMSENMLLMHFGDHATCHNQRLT
jgi:hypothetical protein